MKVSIIGPGRVGSAIGLILVARGLLDELVLVGRRQSVTEAEAADLRHAGAFARAAIVRAGGVPETADSDIVILSIASAAENADVGRDVGGRVNADAFRQLIPALAAASPNAVLLVVSNPVDALTTLAAQLSGFPSGRVLGTGTLLDTMRLRVRLSEICRIHPNDLRAYVLGEHGDRQFVATASASAGGGPLPISAERLRELETEVRYAGHAIVRERGYTNHGVALAAAEVIETIITDRHAILPVSVNAGGFAGVNDVFLSLPAVVGRAGVTNVLTAQLSDAETESFQRAASAVRATLAALGSSDAR